MYKKFIKDSGFIGIGNIITRGFGALFFILIARLYTPADVGYVNYSITVATVAASVAVSIPTVLSRFLGKSKGNKNKLSSYYSNFVFIMGLLGLASVVVTIAVTKYLSKYNVGILAVTAGLIIYWSYFGLIRGLLSTRRIVVFKTSANLLKVTFVLALAFLGVYSRDLLLIVYGLVILIPIFIMEHYRSSKVEFNRALLSKDVLNELVSFSVPIIMMSVAYNILFGADIFLLEHFRGLEEVGFYSVAKNFAVFFILVPDAVTTILMPTVAGLSRKDGIKHLILALVVIVAVTIVWVASLLIFGRMLIELLFTSKYLTALKALYVLAVGIGIYSLNFVFGEYFVGVGKPYAYTWGQGISMTTAIIAGLILIPRNGMLGASLSFTTGCFCGLIYFAFEAYKFVREEGVEDKAVTSAILPEQ